MEFDEGVAPEREICVAFVFQDLGVVCLVVAALLIAANELLGSAPMNGTLTGPLGAFFYWGGLALERQLVDEIEDVEKVPRICRGRV